MTKIVTTVLLSLLCNLAAGAQTAAPLKLQQTIMLPGVTGKFDHFAFDLDTDTLFAAAAGNHTVEAVNIKTGEDSANNHRVRQTTWSGVDSGDDSPLRRRRKACPIEGLSGITLECDWNVEAF